MILIRATDQPSGKNRGGATLSSGSLVGSHRRGNLLLEAIIAIGIFAIFLGGIGVALLSGHRSTIASGDRARAGYLAEQQLEAVRQMRTTDFASVSVGTHGLALQSSGWTFSGSSVIKNGYTTSIVVQSLSTDLLGIQSIVQWNFGNTRSGTVVLDTHLSNWRKASTVGNWSAMTRVANVTLSGTPNFQKIAINGNYAYITSLQSGGGKGLYIYDISNPANPFRVASSFDLGASAYGITAINDRLYIVTDASTEELQVYDITSPSTLALGHKVNSYDIPGSGLARAVSVYNTTVFVGTTEDETTDEFYAIAMSETGPMTLEDSLAMSGTILSLSLSDGYAYASTTYNSAELQVLDIFNPADIGFAPNIGIDLTDVQDANVVIASGTSALLGRVGGSTIDELTLYDISSSPVPTSPPSPWTLETGGDINDIAVAPGSEYAFIAGSSSSAQVMVISTKNMVQYASPVIKKSYSAGATMLALSYDWITDRLYVISSSGLMVFAPG